MGANRTATRRTLGILAGAATLSSLLSGAALAGPTELGALHSGNEKEPVVGVPPVADHVVGHAAVLTAPAHWTGQLSELVARGAFYLPWSIDLVKPELILPVETVPAGNPGGYVFPLPKADPQIDLLHAEYSWNGETKTLADFMKSTNTDATVWVVDGEIVAEYYEDGWSSELRHQPWSVTKSFVSALVGIAIEESKDATSALSTNLVAKGLKRPIEVSDEIQTYIPELAGTNWEGATIENLLQMESGVHWDEGTPVLVVNTQVEQWVALWLHHVTDGASGMNRNEFLKSLPKLACNYPADGAGCTPEGWESGAKFSYNSGNTQVLGWLLEIVYAEGNADKKPFAEILSEKLWKPMGMEADAAIMVDGDGWAVISQGLYSRSHDLARFGELFRLGGRTPAGDPIVPEAWVLASTTHTAISNGAYGYQWWDGVTSTGYRASGFEGNKISVEPDCATTGVRLAHQLGASTRPSGGDPLSPGSYAFAVEMGGDEWHEVYRAVLRELGRLGNDGDCPSVN